MEHSLMHSVKNLLVRLDNLLDNKDKWTQGAFARDKDGNAVHYDDPTAVCYCLTGAISKVTLDASDYILGSYYELTREVAKNLPSGQILLAAFNDSSNFTDVKRLISTAILNAGDSYLNYLRL
jgi:hypothetical protein